jgi:hypothetical protein
MLHDNNANVKHFPSNEVVCKKLLLLFHAWTDFSNMTLILTATMKVYQDFFLYRGGVYHHSDYGAEASSGYHSVRIVGWGEDVTRGEPIKYWVRVNCYYASFAQSA